MRAKLLNICLLLASLLGYLEWGVDQQAFLFQVERDVLVKMVQNPLEVLHPVVLVPLVGQLLLTFTLFQNRPGRYLTFIGMGAISVIVWLITCIGLMQLNFWMVLSTLPYIVTSIITLRFHRKQPDL